MLAKRTLTTRKTTARMRRKKKKPRRKEMTTKRKARSPRPLDLMTRNPTQRKSQLHHQARRNQKSQSQSQRKANLTQSLASMSKNHSTSNQSCLPTDISTLSVTLWSSRPSPTPRLRSFGSTRRPRPSDLKAEKVPHGTSLQQAKPPTCKYGKPMADGSKSSSMRWTIS